jgi:hypothetical protein
MLQFSTKVVNIIALFSLSNLVSAADMTTQYAYITHGQSYKTPSILQCAIDPVTGDLSNCNDTASGSVYGPTGVAFNQASGKTFAYISNMIAFPKVTQCEVDTKSGEFSNCNPISDPAFYWLSGIAISNNHLYVVNHDSKVIQCAIDSKSGAISGCAFTGNPAITAVNIAINAGYAYLTNVQPEQAQGNILRCPVMADGNLSAVCKSTAGFGPNLFGITVNNKYVYVTDGWTVSQNTVDTKGHLLNVRKISFKSPVGISFNNGFAYVVNFTANDGNGTVSKCSVDATTGNLLNCKNEVNIDYPTSIAIH